MDESFIDFERDAAKAGESWSCVSALIEKINMGMAILEAVRSVSSYIYNDVAALKKARHGPDYKPKSGDVILGEFLAFLKGKIKAERLCETISVSQTTIHLTKRKRMASRYAGTPTIVLDATIHREVAEAAFPGFEFVKISVKQHDNFRVFQAQNVNFSKSFLNDGNNLAKAIANATAIAKRYHEHDKAVHVISAKQIPGKAAGMTFAEFVANEIEATEFGHFGHLRGTNRFAVADCLIIFGWPRIPNDDLIRKATALFGPIEDTTVEAEMSRSE